MSLRPLEIITRAADVGEKLASYHRERIEAGELFHQAEYRDRSGRADERLLHDVRAVTSRLIYEGLDRAASHVLVERVILVRYLEDRGVLTRGYFEDIAGKRAEWRELLDSAPLQMGAGEHSNLVACLLNKDFTYALFRQLAEDFNGDLFVVSDDEIRNVSTGHLALIQRLLSGAGLEDQGQLFLWAYDFSVVPTSLISSMYEQFYRNSTDDDNGTHYTPPELVEFVLAQTLTDEILQRSPRVCDPACGSGIFLVEAFRRIVRHEMAVTGGGLTYERLRHLLLTRIAGVDLNSEAVRLAAFSLYLAFLNYQSPQDIRAAGPLPRLIYSPERASDIPVLIVADAFAPMTPDEPDEASPAQECLPWPEHAFDVLVGNPPWDEPTEKAVRSGDAWAKLRGFPVGDRSPSQQFLWRSLSLLRADGVAALLVAATPFHNRRSAKFRRKWLQSVTLELVVNFTSARTVFFSGGIAPFVLVKFRTDTAPESGHLVHYRTVYPSTALERSRSMAYARIERRWVSQSALQRRDYLWKTYAWGSHRDDALMARLDAEDPLAAYLPKEPKPGFGYQPGHDPPSETLTSLPTLRKMVPWGSLEPSWFDGPPIGTKRNPDERRYSGQRVVIAEGVKAGFGPNARLEYTPFSFRHMIYCLPLPGMPEWRAKTILGIILSRLGRYRLFMTNGSWGVWHDKFNKDDFLSLPVRLSSQRSSATKKLVRAVTDLKRATDKAGTLGVDPHDDARGEDVADVLSRIDHAVYDLFELTSAERDLVDDFHKYTLPLVGRPSAWRSLAQVKTAEDSRGTIAMVDEADRGIRSYLEAFLGMWNRELAPDGEFRWRVLRSPRVPMLAAIFETQLTGRGMESSAEDGSAWESALGRLYASLRVPVTASIATEGCLRSVSETSIVIVKRNEARLWSATAAREDAEATMLRAMALKDR